MSAPLGRVLEDLRSQAGGPGSRMLLATIGQRLLQQGLDLKTDAGLKLGVALRRYPGFCRVDGHQVTFLDGPADSPQGALVLPVHPLSAGQNVARGLAPDLWRARVLSRDGVSWWMDLEDLTVQEVQDVQGEPAPPDPAQAWRYVQVPTISTDDQIAFVRGWLQDRANPVEIERICAADFRWQVLARESLDPATHRDLQDAHREWVVDQTLPWLDEHDIDHRRVLQVRKVSRRAVGLEPQPAGSGQVDALRARILACVQAMTLAELAELRIPARFLLYR